jgi:hypothetical protein
MLTVEDREFIRRAEQLYEERLKVPLEEAHRDEYVVIEPDSGDYILGRTVGEAKALARAAHAGRMVHVMRVGHPAAYHIGGAT